MYVVLVYEFRAVVEGHLWGSLYCKLQRWNSGCQACAASTFSLVILLVLFACCETRSYRQGL